MRSGSMVVFSPRSLCVVGGGLRLPSPPDGGLEGSPISVLILSNGTFIDRDYEKELRGRGYRIEKTSFYNRLNFGYLKQFNVIILTRLPYAGEQYWLGGHKLAYFEHNTDLIHRYVEEGGGLIFEPSMSEFGEAYAYVYNRFLERYGVRYLALQLRDDAESAGDYARAVPATEHSLVEGLKNFLYPTNFLRWDNAYSTVPLVVEKEWTVLVRGKAGPGTYEALDNVRVGEKLTEDRNIFAIRKYRKGWIALSAIHSYYTLTHTRWKKANIGENHTGIIDGIVLYGDRHGRKSQFGELLERTYRFLALKSRAEGF